MTSSLGTSPLPRRALGPGGPAVGAAGLASDDLALLDAAPAAVGPRS